jgi:hypothetical protein
MNDINNAINDAGAKGFLIGVFLTLALVFSCSVCQHRDERLREEGRIETLREIKFPSTN